MDPMSFLTFILLALIFLFWKPDSHPTLRLAPYKYPLTCPGGDLFQTDLPVDVLCPIDNTEEIDKKWDVKEEDYDYDDHRGLKCRFFGDLIIDDAFHKAVHIRKAQEGDYDCSRNEHDQMEQEDGLPDDQDDQPSTSQSVKEQKVHKYQKSNPKYGFESTRRVPQETPTDEEAREHGQVDEDINHGQDLGTFGQAD